jgi:fluoride exporter
MSNPSESSSELSQVDLGEYIHRMSLPSLSSLTVPQEIAGRGSASGSRSNSALSVNDSDRESRQRREQQARETARNRMSIPPPRTSSQRRSRFIGFEGVFGQPSIMDNLVEVSSPTPIGRRRRSTARPDEFSSPLDGLTDLTVAEPVESTRSKSSRPQSMVEQVRELAKQARRNRLSETDLTPVTRGHFSTPRSYRGDTDELTLAAAPPPSISPFSHRRSRLDDAVQPLSRSVSRLEQVDVRDLSSFATQLYIISYLIFFSILGTAARVGLKHLCFYAGAPIDIPIVWANFAGCFVLGFLLEDRNIFLEGWGHSPTGSPVNTLEKARENHLNIKKTIPLYIGLATGFCGSLTSFSSFMLDSFLAMSNNLPTPVNHPYPSGFELPPTASTVHRNAGYSVAALLAVVILNITVSLSGLKVGAHCALFLDGWIPSIPFKIMRNILDIAIVPLAWLSWLGTLVLVIWPPDRPGGSAGRDSWLAETWRGDVLVALVLAPLGCVLRYVLALKLNGVSAYFPLGTFAANVFGTAVLGMSYDLQHVALGQGYAAGIGGGLLGCQVLQGLMDGFCGALTTVSTWAAEMVALDRHGYSYGGVTTVSGICIMVIVCGSVRWSIGFQEIIC